MMLSCDGRDYCAIWVYDEIVMRVGPLVVVLRFFVWIIALQVRAVAFTNDGNRCLVGGGDKMAIIYDTASGKELITIEREGVVGREAIVR